MVHRVDGELAAGGLVGAVDPVLAADGVEEVLEWFAGHPGVLAHSASRAGAAGEVYVDAGDHAFVVELPDDGHAVREVDPLLGLDVVGPGHRRRGAARLGRRPGPAALGAADGR